MRNAIHYGVHYEALIEVSFLWDKGMSLAWVATTLELFEYFTTYFVMHIDDYRYVSCIHFNKTTKTPTVVAITAHVVSPHSFARYLHLHLCIHSRQSISDHACKVEDRWLKIKCYDTHCVEKHGTVIYK